MQKLSLISDDLKKLVDASLSTANIKKYELCCMNRFNIGRVIVKCVKGEKPVIELPETANKAYMKLWKNDVGSVLVSELKKETPELFELVTANFRALLKKISDDEFDAFKEKGFVHVVLADSRYTILKAVGQKKSYSESSDDYDFEDDFDESMNSSQIIEQDEIYKEPVANDSYQLF